MAELLAAAPCVELQQASTAHFASLQVSHGHKFRAQEWMAQRFPEATQCGSGKDVVVFALDDPERVVAAMRRDGHARRFVHAATACHLRVARADAVAGAVVALYDGCESLASAKLVVHFDRALKGSLLAALPERLALAPRGHSHCLTVEPVSSGGDVEGYYVGVCAAGDEFATDDAVIASKRDGHAVSRAYFKLREAADVFGFGARLGGGASSTSGVAWRLEPAVPRARRGPRRRRRPGRPRRVAAGRLRRRRPRPRAREGPGVDRRSRRAPAALRRCVCDANAHPAAALRLLAPAVCPLLRRGAALVLTLKQPTATNKHADGEFAEVLAALAEHGFAGPRIAWLWANGRHERTLGATYEPGQASGAFAS
ncbi:FtsJ-like methyltransferase [Aureococcus anophagefferens]|nr:FtsJ-like methyltransferase [Aureococcus anophagefferens]